MESPFSQSLSRKPLQSILVKPTSADCNLACEYCFYLEKAELYPLEKQRRMPLDVMEEMVKQVMETGQPSLSFGWQGGEPTLMGLDFFRKAVECQKKYGRQGQSVGNGLQTNGILITDEWCDFFNEYSFLIGLSLDGPQHVHDRYRFTIGGGPSWRKVEDAAKRMLERGVAVNALSVLNDYSAEYPQEIYEYHKSLGFEFLQFIPCVEPDIEGIKAAPFSVTGEQYGRFLCEIFDLWRKDFVDGKPTISVRYFDSLFHLYVNMPPPECTLLEECGCYVVVEHNGDVYSCDFFVQPEWKLGNLMKGNLNDFLNGDQQTRFGCLKKEIPPECVDCPLAASMPGRLHKGPDQRSIRPRLESLLRWIQDVLRTYRRSVQTNRRRMVGTTAGGRRGILPPTSGIRRIHPPPKSRPQRPLPMWKWEEV